MYCTRIYKYLLIVVVLFGTTGCPTVYLKTVTGVVKHANCSNPKGGSIEQTINPAFSNFTADHLWNTGATSEDLHGVGCIYPAYYTDKIKLQQGNYQPLYETTNYDVLMEVNWTKVNGMAYDGGLRKTYKGSSSPQVAYSVSSNILPQNAQGYIEYQVNVTDKSISCKAYVGYNDVTAYTLAPPLTSFTGFALETDNSLTGQDVGKISIILNGQPVFVSTIGNFKSGDKFCVKYSNSNVVFLHNGAIAHQTLSTYSFSHPAKVVQATLSEQNMFITEFNATFGCVDRSDAYVELSKELDATCYAVTNNIMFKYKEKYNDNSPQCKIYDWERNIVLTPTVSTSNNNGINFHIVNIGNTLASDDVYIMEITNDKGELYKMRFRYNYFKEKVNISPTKNPYFPSSGVKEGIKYTFGNDYE